MIEHEHSKSNPLEQDSPGSNVTKFVPRSRQGRRNTDETAPASSQADNTPFDDDDDDPGPTAA